MSFKPWKQPLLAALFVAAGTTAATAQDVQKAQRAIELDPDPRLELRKAGVDVLGTPDGLLDRLHGCASRLLVRSHMTRLRAQGASEVTHRRCPTEGRAWRGDGAQTRAEL